MRASAAVFVAACILAGCSRHATVPVSNQLTIYYCRAGSGQLVPMHYSGSQALSGVALERYVVNQLIVGPDVGRDNVVLFPSGTSAVVTQQGGTATVDLHGPLTHGSQSGGTDEAALFKSLTYTLTALPGVKAVQVDVNGKKMAALPGGAFDISEPLTRETFAQ